jgi:hypothetical protein
MGGFLPIYVTGFWPPVMDAMGRIAVPSVHGYRPTVVLLEEFGREDFGRRNLAFNPGGRRPR